jgi:hypothetical protein
MFVLYNFDNDDGVSVSVGVDVVVDTAGTALRATSVRSI